MGKIAIKKTTIVNPAKLSDEKLKKSLSRSYQELFFGNENERVRYTLDLWKKLIKRSDALPITIDIFYGAITKHIDFKQPENQANLGRLILGNYELFELIFKDSFFENNVVERAEQLLFELDINDLPSDIVGVIESNRAIIKSIFNSNDKTYNVDSISNHSKAIYKFVRFNAKKPFTNINHEISHIADFILSSAEAFKSLTAINENINNLHNYIHETYLQHGTINAIPNELAYLIVKYPKLWEQLDPWQYRSRFKRLLHFFGFFKDQFEGEREALISANNIFKNRFNNEPINKLINAIQKDGEGSNNGSGQGPNSYTSITNLTCTSPTISPYGSPTKSTESPGVATGSNSPVTPNSVSSSPAYSVSRASPNSLPPTPIILTKTLPLSNASNTPYSSQDNTNVSSSSKATPQASNSGLNTPKATPIIINNDQQTNSAGVSPIVTPIIGVPFDNTDKLNQSKTSSIITTPLRSNNSLQQTPIIQASSPQSRSEKKSPDGTPIITGSKERVGQDNSSKLPVNRELFPSEKNTSPSFTIL